MIVLQGRELSKNFGGLLALDGVDFELREGEILGLIGPNGSGKTTLFNVVSGFYLPEKGTVIYRGKDIARMRPDKVCRMGIGRTFQLIHPFKSLTVFDNVRVGAVFGKWGFEKAHALERRVGEILETLDLSEKRNVAVQSLTIGDLRRLELARALATRPDVLLLDEVLAGLTPVETEGLMATIRRIRDSGISIFIIEHVMKAIMGLSDRIIVLEFGVKIAEGGPDEVVRDEAVVKAYLGEADAS